MKRFVSSLAVCALLAACSPEQTVRYSLTFDTRDTTRQAQLVSTGKKVVERRLRVMDEGFDLGKIDMQVNGSDIRLSVTAEDPALLAALTEQLSAPFSLRVMRQTEDPRAPIHVEGLGSFEDTGLNESHVDWAVAQTDGLTGRGMVTMTLTVEGRDAMHKAFTENVGKTIGIFVRDRLVSQKTIDKSEAKDRIIIADIPKVEIANLFADDVNVGLHVRFSLAGQSAVSSPPLVSSSARP